MAGSRATWRASGTFSTTRTPRRAASSRWARTALPRTSPWRPPCRRLRRARATPAGPGTSRKTPNCWSPRAHLVRRRRWTAARRPRACGPSRAASASGGPWTGAGGRARSPSPTRRAPRWSSTTTGTAFGTSSTRSDGSLRRRPRRSPRSPSGPCASVRRRRRPGAPPSARGPPSARPCPSRPSGCTSSPRTSRCSSRSSSQSLTWSRWAASSCQSPRPSRPSPACGPTRRCAPRTPTAGAGTSSTGSGPTSSPPCTYLTTWWHTPRPTTSSRATPSSLAAETGPPSSSAPSARTRRCRARTRRRSPRRSGRARRPTGRRPWA
mmetsp:Transcript_6116/g.20877  ORF Transcript_6116/g.20877 Transcript_6116/m.20877 type:complete len:323 (-) Transcript_6116:580-1548(-)